MRLNLAERLSISAALLLGMFAFVVVGGIMAYAYASGGTVVLDFRGYDELLPELVAWGFVGVIMLLGGAAGIRLWTAP